MRTSYLYIIITILLSLAASCIIFFFLPIFNFKGFEKALEGILLLSSICLGFYGACLSVLASIFNTKIVREIMNDGKYRSDFILISICALISGFILVLTTIVYQVLLENGGVSFVVLNTINSFWIFLLFAFLSFSLLFILVSFVIFFNNKETSNEQIVNKGEIKNEDF